MTTTTKLALAVGQRWLTAGGYEAYIASSEPRPHSLKTANAWHVNLLGLSQSDSWSTGWCYYDNGTAPATPSDYTLTTLLPKLSVGQRWRTRDGQEVVVTNYIPDDSWSRRWPYRCSNGVRYTPEGFQLSADKEGEDLVQYLGSSDEPTNTTTKTPRLRVGQVWRDRAGRICRVESYDGKNEATDTSDNWYVSRDGESFNRTHYSDGWYYFSHQSDLDLVELISEAPTAAPEATPQQPAPPRFTSVVPLPTAGSAYAIAEDGNLWHLSGTSALRVVAQQ